MIQKYVCFLFCNEALMKTSAIVGLNYAMAFSKSQDSNKTPIHTYIIAGSWCKEIFYKQLLGASIIF